MAKITLTSITSRYASVAALNANFQALATALENTLSRDGTSPNDMDADLDMNSNDILNAGTINATAFKVNGVTIPSTGLTLDELTDVVITSASNGQVLKYNGTNWVNGTDNTGAGGSTAAADVTFTPAGNIAAANVQLALQELDTEKSSTSHNHSGVYEPVDAQLVRKNVANTFSAVQTPATGTASVSTTSDFNFDPSTHGQVCTVTLTNAITVTLKVSAGKAVAGAHYTLILKAGDTSARTFAKGTTFLAPSATLPITSGTVTSGSWDVLHLVGVDTNTVAVVGSAADVR